MESLTYKDLDYRRLLIKHYRVFKLNENDLAVLLCLDDFLNDQEEKTLVTIDDLLIYMTLSKEQIDDILNKLINLKLIDYSTINNKVVTSLDPLYKKLVDGLKRDIVFESKQKENFKINNEINNTIYSYFENELGRTLAGKEIDRISLWLKNGISKGMINEAVEKLKNSGKRVSIAAVDKIILALQQNKEILAEGKALTSSFEAGDKKAQEILSKRWVN